MKRRVLVAASVLSLALPTLLADTGLTPFDAPVAFAQGAPSDPITEAARAKYQEGVKAFEAGKYEDARSAFLQAYALKRVPAVLLNLGQSEIKSGHYEDGGNHLQQFIREHKAAKTDEVAAAQTGIAEAKKKTGYLIIIVNAVGADLSVNGVAIGKSPLLDPYFVKPGKTVIYASFQGQAATTAVDVKKGIATSATVTLNVAAPQPTAPVGTATAPTAPPLGSTPPPVYTAPPTYTSTAPVPTSPYPSSTAPYVPPAATDPLAQPPPMGTGTAPDQPSGGREPIFDWFKRKPVAWVGAGVTGVGLIMGIGFSAAAGAASNNVNSYAEQIRIQATKDQLTGRPCGVEDDPNDDVLLPTNYHPACETLRTSLGQYRTDVALAATGWVLFGLGAIGTTVYAMLDWYPNRQQTAQGPRLIAVTPIVSDKEGGIGLIGEW
ncbi:MAG: hypothetical protein R3B70_12245 [Polyangiaceae bacterium]